MWSMKGSTFGPISPTRSDLAYLSAVSALWLVMRGILGPSVALGFEGARRMLILGSAPLR